MGAEKFLDTGDSVALSNLISTTINPILKRTRGKHKSGKIIRKIHENLENFSGGLYTVRGNKLSDYGIKLKESLELIKDIDIDELKPFEKILDKIYGKVVSYSKDIVKDVHFTVLICKDFRLIQQAYTLLSENILNYLCIKAELNHLIRENRKTVKRILLSKHDHHKKNIILKDNEIEIGQKIGLYTSADLAQLYDSLVVNFRNDINHGGFREDPKGYSVFTNKLDDFILEFEKLVFTNEIEIEETK